MVFTCATYEESLGWRRLLIVGAEHRVNGGMPELCRRNCDNAPREWSGPARISRPTPRIPEYPRNIDSLRAGPAHPEHRPLLRTPPWISCGSLRSEHTGTASGTSGDTAN